MLNRGRSVRLFLADGSATGIISAEIINWTGQVLVGPRTRLGAALKRDEIRKTGVYIIYSSDTDSDLPAVYVGEGDDIGARLLTHSKDDTKDYWDRFVAITNKDMNLTKAHVKYLESKLIGIVKSAKKSALQNKTAPEFDKLPESDISDMDAFIDEILLVLPVVGVNFLRKPSTPKPAETNTRETLVIFVTENSNKSINAKAMEIDGEFVILAGSTGSLHEGPSFRTSGKIKALRDRAIESGRVSTLNKTFTVVDDIAFSSPSAAAVFLYGTSRNGRTDWIVENTSQTYGSWKEQSLTEVSHPNT